MPGADEVVSQLQNIAVQLSAWNQAVSNATPAATTTTSPKFTAISLSTSAITVLVSTSSIRHGIVFHNPGTTTCYVFQTGMASAPTTSTLGGALMVAGGSTVPFPSAQYPNINCGFSGFSGTGTAVAFTVIEFF
jgi:hypothetical protein